MVLPKRSTFGGLVLSTFGRRRLLGLSWVNAVFDWGEGDGDLLYGLRMTNAELVRSGGAGSGCVGSMKLDVSMRLSIKVVTS